MDFSFIYNWFPLGLHDKLHAIVAFIIADESPPIMNAILHSLSVIYGSVY